MAAERTDIPRTSGRWSEQAVSAALTRYRFMANVVGVLLIALIVVAVPLKYFADMPTPVLVLGTAHGWLYFLFFLSAIDLALRAKWSLKGTVLTVLAGAGLPGRRPLGEEGEERHGAGERV
jgi:integral membrane protein